MTDKSPKKQYDLENAKAQMRKGFLEFPVLSIIGEREAYASEILAQLKAANLLIVEGTLYPLLSRLKRCGLLEYEWQESTGGPPRKYYRLTAEGREVLAALGAAWQELEKSISTLSRQNTKMSKKSTKDKVIEKNTSAETKRDSEKLLTKK